MIYFNRTKKSKSKAKERSNGLKILLTILIILSVSALLIIGYEISQNYQKSKKLENITITNENEAGMGYNLIEDIKRDDLGIQNL